MSDQAIAQPSLLRRPHTVLGVCEGLGEDFGFNPVILRVAFAIGIYFAPVAVVVTYLGLGGVLAFARWAYPIPSATPAPAEVEPEEMRIAA
jgi:phage shock protein C